MAEMVSEIYDALIAAGAPEDKARAAAVAVVSLKDEPWKRAIEKDMAGIRVEIASMRVEMAEIKGTQRLHAWILGTNTAMLIALLFKVFAQ
jgi:hypothetical protein